MPGVHAADGVSPVSMLCSSALFAPALCVLNEGAGLHCAPGGGCLSAWSLLVSPVLLSRTWTSKQPLHQASGKEMSGLCSDRAPVTFVDVTAYFPDEEWKLLQEWQKELYRNVMKEIHQALLSLGPLIATTVLSLSTPEKSAMCSVHNHSVRRPGINCCSGDTVANPDVLVRKDREEHLFPKPPLDTEDRERNDCLSTGEEKGFPSLSDGSLRMEEEPTLSLMDHLAAEVQQNTTSSVVTFTIKEEEDDTYSLDQQHSEKAGGLARPTGDPVFTSGFSQSLKPEKEVHFQKEPEPRGRTTGEGSKNRKREAVYFIACPEKTTGSIDLCGKAKVKFLKSTEKGMNSINQPQSESNLELGGDEATQSESGFMNPQHSKFYQGTSSIERADTYSDCESNQWNANLLTGQPNAQINFRPYVCSECEKSFKTKQHLTRHQRTHSGERPYHCTECEKSFSLKHHLIGHQRTHTGERPYQCPECEKRFSLKGNLNNHQRTHIVAHEQSQLGGIIPMRNQTWRS